MSVYISTVFDAFRVQINAVDTTSPYIYEEEHLDMVPWEDLTPPYWVIHAASLPFSEEWSGLNGLAYEPEVMLYYIHDVKGSSAPLFANIEALRDRLVTNPTAMTVGQVLNVTNLTWANNIEPNLVFASKNYTHRAALLTVDYLIGEVVTV